MIERYALPEMGALWSEEFKLEAWKRVETLALEAWERLGKVPVGVAAATDAAGCPTPAQVAEREQVTNHDLAAFVDLLGESAGGDAPAWIHYGLTSSDVLDTATGFILKESCAVLMSALEDLYDTVRDLALKHQSTPMIGRTHGIWAEPTTFGLKLSGWAFEVERNLERLLAAATTVSVGTISGAVGTYASLPPSIEKHVCDALGLTPEPAPTQVTARDRHAQYLQALALIGSSIERFATEVRHLQRSEVAEVREGFRPGQKGSSAMPHKRNPILSERMTGMARLLRGYSQVGLENVALWHERDISHSSAERVILPDASTVAHYMLVKFRGLLQDLVVDEERMMANLEASNGLVFSQSVLLSLVEAGMTRDEAYRAVQANAMTAWESGEHLMDLLAADERIPLDADSLAVCFSLDTVQDSAQTAIRRLLDRTL